jgi:hypothetical protein
MPLRGALRALRHVVRRGGEALIETLPVDSLPGPTAVVAEKVLREVEEIARGLDEAASGLAKRVIGGTGAQPPALGLAPDPRQAATFAAAAYAALRAALKRIGAGGAFVSEAAARTSYLALPRDRAATEADRAADLALALLAARVVRDAPAHPAARVGAADVPGVAVFAVLLWLVAPRAADEAEGEAALDAAVDLTVAIADDVAAACAARDRARLAALFAEFADNV